MSRGDAEEEGPGAEDSRDGPADALPLPRAPGGPEALRPPTVPSACQGVTAQPRGPGLSFDFVLMSALRPRDQSCRNLSLSLPRAGSRPQSPCELRRCLRRLRLSSRASALKSLTVHGGVVAQGLELDTCGPRL